MYNSKGTEMRARLYKGVNNNTYIFSLLSLLFLSFLIVLSRYNYLVFHTLSEFISIAVAWGLFLIVWNTRDTSRNDALLFLGLAYFFIGGLDLLHTLAYKGMGVFNQDESANPATQLWIIARYLEGFSLCLFPFFLGKRLKVSLIFGTFTIFSLFAVLSIFKWQVFPDCYIEGSGLTSFKRYSEYVVSVLLSFALIILYRKKRKLNETVYKYLFISIILNILGELLFSFYISVYGLSNLLGHLLKIVSFYFVYKAMIFTGLKKPFDLLYKEISDKEKQYRQMFETNLAIKLVIDPVNGSIVDANYAACSFYGYSREDLLTLSISDINTLSQEEISEEMKRVILEEKLFFNFRHKLASGEIRNVEVYSGPIQLSRKTYLYSIIHDVTERKKADSLLKESEFFFRESQRIASIGSYKLDFNSGNWESSEVLDRILGIDKNYSRTIEGWADIIHHDDREMMIHYLNDEVIAKNRPFDKEYRIIRKSDGEQRYVRGSGELTFDSEGNVLFMMGTIIDISESKMAESALLKSSRLNRQIISSVHEGIIVYAKDLSYQVWNPFMEQLTGLMAVDVLGKQPGDLFPILNDVGVSERLELALKGEIVTPIEFLYSNSNKSAWVLDSSSALKDESGNIIGVIGTVQDITVRKESDIALINEKERLAVTLRSIGDGVITTDTRGQVVMLNKAAEVLTGWVSQEAIGRSLSDIFNIVDKRTGKPCNNLVEKALQSKSSVRQDNRISLISKDGSRFQILSTASPIISREEDITGVVIVFSDITVETVLQEQIHQHSKMESIGQLAGGMAHDFNNMLSGIMSSAQLLKSPQRNLDEKGNKYVDFILNASERAAELIANLLSFGRKKDFTSSAVDINQVIAETISIAEKTIDKKIIFSLENNSPGCIISGDLSRLQNVFLNLFINGSHAMGNGGLINIITEEISIDKAYCSTSSFNIREGLYCKIQISDTGTGIEAENIDKIFEPFFTTKEQGKGTGLGLAAAYGTILDHKGEIQVQSELGVGTSFTILLPSITKSVNKKIEDDTMIPGQGTILLVDDEEINRILIKDILDSLGYRVIIAVDGLESLEIFSKRYHEIDVVIMDMIMPKMNGSEAFYKMKEIDEKCKVIISSGYTSNININGLIDDGLAGYISKPYTISDISRLLGKIR